MLLCREQQTCSLTLYSYREAVYLTSIVVMGPMLARNMLYAIDMMNAQLRDDIDEVFIGEVTQLDTLKDVCNS